MDPRNPYRFSQQKFVDLLNSQKNSNGYDNPIPPNSAQSSQPVLFCFTFSSQPVHFSPEFSSQPLNFSPTSESEDCIEVIVDENEEDAGRRSRKRWSAEEDVNLISAWLNISKDPVVSNEQQIDSFWKRVTDYYKANDGASGSNARGPSQCKARWNKINHQVNKFVGCYAKASARRKSGGSEDNVMSMAYEKWIPEECSHKQTKFASEGAYSATSSNDGAEMRPPAVKASKKKGKKPEFSSDVEDGSIGKLDRIIAMKDQEQATKERHTKMRLLDSLRNKGFGTTYEAVSLSCEGKHVGCQANGSCLVIKDVLCFNP
ncbi:PREDICTED: glutathione S-transferase T3-like [Camelina sativa]|uniref:Glutathione S-transferase T3-like n=1 Tax=Camelina sativa TaxID=90675 RepID=A0ABM0VYJ7_CAMSA|nr:PREDICTED: glutathione S-transferase T3-like [Camelina sativa]